MYNKIYDFCQVRNIGNIYKNDKYSPPPRVVFLTQLLSDEGIDFIIDKFEVSNTFGYSYH